MSLANVTLNDTFDTWRTRTNQLIAVQDQTLLLAQTAFDYANSTTQTAANIAEGILVTDPLYRRIIYDAANVIGNNIIGPVCYAISNNGVNSAYALVNNATNVTLQIANLAYETANFTGIVANTSGNTANFSYIVSNASFEVSNTAGNTANYSGDVANAAGLVANTSANTANFAGLVANTSGNTANFSYQVSNAAFLVANTAGNTANFSYQVSNASFLVSNTAGNTANYAFDTSNQAFLIANVAANTANVFTANAVNIVSQVLLSNTLIQDSINTSANIAVTEYLATSPIVIAWNSSNAGYHTANAAFDKTNVAFSVANAAFDSANNVAPQVAPSYNTANAAFARVNAAYAVVNAAYDSANNVAPQIAPSYNTANASFARVNVAFAVANAAFDSANNVAPQVAPSFSAANAAFANANGTHTFAIAAFTTANAALPKTGGTVSGDVIVTGNLTISGCTTYTNTNTLLVGDNIITLNADLPSGSVPTENAGVEVNRGSRNSNAAILWIEAANAWALTGNLLQSITTYIASNTDVGYVYQHANAAFDKANTSLSGDSPTLTGTMSMQANVSSQTLSDGSGSISWDVSLGQVATVTLSGANRAIINPTNLKVGTYILHVYQDGNGSRTITSWGTKFKFPAGVKPTLSTAAGAHDIVSFVSDWRIMRLI